jgi:hypothetical protein
MIRLEYVFNNILDDAKRLAVTQCDHSTEDQQ